MKKFKTGQFKQVVEGIVERLSELLGTQVSVMNHQGMIIASNSPDACDSLQKANYQLSKAYVRMPIQLAGQMNELVILKSDHSEPVSPRLLQGLVDLIIHQATANAQLPNQPELKNKFIHDLLRGSAAHETDILRDAQILRMDLTRPRAVILIDASDYIFTSADFNPLSVPEMQVWQRAEFIIDSIVRFFHLPNDTICAYIGDGEVAVLKASSSQDLAAWTTQDDEPSQLNCSWTNLTALKRAGTALLARLRCDTQTSISIGIGRYHPKLQGLAHSYQDARAALSLGKRFHGPNQLHCLDRLGIAAFVGVSDEETKIDLARHLVSPLDQEAELLETLNVFFSENCCSSTTAKQLSIHRNTLSYRLEKVTLLTGLDPRRFDDAMQIRLALLLRSLRGDAPELRKRPISSHAAPKYIKPMPNAS